MAVLLLLAVVALILVALLYTVLRRSKHGGLAGGDSTCVPPLNMASLNTGRSFSQEEVAKHDSPDDLWLIINDKVYDFTEVSVRRLASLTVTAYG